MAEKLPSPDELRTQARTHRGEALRVTDPQTRQMHLTVADEFEKLAAAIESEIGATPRKQSAQS